MGNIIAKEITHAEYMKMLNTVRNCTEWSKKLRDGIGGRFAFFPTVSVGKDFLQEMRDAARIEGTLKHIDVLNEVFGEEAPQPKFKVGDWVRITKEWCKSDTFKKDSVHRITKVNYNNMLGNTYYYFSTGANCVATNLKPWTPEVGEWVVANEKDGALKVTSLCTIGANTPHSTYLVDAENENTKSRITDYCVNYLRPATKEEVEKAKVEDMVFFDIKPLADLIAISKDKGNGGISYEKYRIIPGLSKEGKAQWINKTLTKALKDERLW